MSKRFGGYEAAVAATWIGLVLLQFLSTPVLAQERAKAIDPERLALATKLFEVCGQRKLVEDSLPLGLDYTTQMYALGRPDLERAMREKPTQAHEIIRKHAPQVLDIYVRAYARELSKEEMTEHIRFCESPVGAKIVAKMPSVMMTVSVEKIALAANVSREIKMQILGAPSKSALSPEIDAGRIRSPSRAESRASRPPRNAPAPRPENPAVPESKP